MSVINDKIAFKCMDIPQPPKDLEKKTVIDKLAQFVAKNGTDFECMTKRKQKGNPKFDFLFGGEFQDYYLFKVSILQKQFESGFQENMLPQSGYHDHPMNQSMNEPPHSKPSRWAPVSDIPLSSNGSIPLPPEPLSHMSRWGPSPVPPGGNNPDNGGALWPGHPINPPPVNVPMGWDPALPQKPYMRPPDIPSNAPWASTMPPMSVNLQPTQSHIDRIKEICDLKSQLGQAEHQLNQQEAKMNAEIQESENNLQAQYQTLMSQEPIKVETALVQARQEEVLNLTQTLSIQIEEMNSMIQPLIESCTKENICRAKSWIIDKTQTSNEISHLIAKYLLSRSAARHVSFDLRLHVIYLINDLLHHCKRKGGVPPLLGALQEVVVPCFCLAIELSDEQKRQKLDKVLSLWESNSYLAADLLPLMRDPYKQLNIWLNEEKKRHTDIVQSISGSIQAQYISMQHQHLEFANHQKAQTLGQKQLVEQLKQKLASLEQHQPPHQQPPPQNIPLPGGPPPNWSNQPPSHPPRQGFTFGPGIPPDHPNMSHAPPVSDPSVPPTQRFPPASVIPPGFPPIQPTSVPSIDARPHLPDFSKPPPGFDPALLNGPPPGFPPKEESRPEPTQSKRFDAELIPSLPYFELPAALIVPLIKLSDFEMKPIDPQDLRLPPPVPPSERLQNAVKVFYAPASHERPRDCDGWERLGLHEFYKAKELAKRDPEYDRPTVSYDDLVQMAAMMPVRGPTDFVPNRPIGSGGLPRPGFNPRGMPPIRRDDQMLMQGSNRWPPSNEWRQPHPGPMNMGSVPAFTDNRDRPRDRDARNQGGRDNFGFGGFSRKRDTFRSRSRSRSPTRSRSVSRSRSRSRSRSLSRSRSRSHSRSVSKSRSRSRSKSRSISRERSKTRSSSRSRSASPPRFTSAGGQGTEAPPLIRDRLSEERVVLGVNSQNDFDTQTGSSFALGSSNKGHQMMQKMGWSGTKGLGLREQGRTDPISAESDVRDKSDVYRGIGLSSDEFDDFRKRKSQGFSAMMKTRSDIRAAAKEATHPPSNT